MPRLWLTTPASRTVALSRVRFPQVKWVKHQVRVGSQYCDPESAGRVVECFMQAVRFDEATQHLDVDPAICARYAAATCFVYEKRTMNRVERSVVDVIRDALSQRVKRLRNKRAKEAALVNAPSGLCASDWAGLSQDFATQRTSDAWTLAQPLHHMRITPTAAEAVAKDAISRFDMDTGVGAGAGPPGGAGGLFLGLQSAKRGRQPPVFGTRLTPDGRRVTDRDVGRPFATSSGGVVGNDIDALVSAAMRPSGSRTGLTPNFGAGDGTTPNFGYPSAAVHGGGVATFGGGSSSSGGGGGFTPNVGDGMTPNFGAGGGGGFVLDGPAASATFRGACVSAAEVLVNSVGAASIDEHFGGAQLLQQQQQQLQLQLLQLQRQQQQQPSGAAGAAARATASQDAAATAPPPAPQRPQTTSTGVGDGVWDTVVNEDGSLERRRRPSDSPKGTTIVFST